MPLGQLDSWGDPAPLCECGCGAPVLTCANGIWARWLSGHNGRTQKGVRR